MYMQDIGTSAILLSNRKKYCPKTAHARSVIYVQKNNIHFILFILYAAKIDLGPQPVVVAIVFISLCLVCVLIPTNCSLYLYLPNY